MYLSIQNDIHACFPSCFTERFVNTLAKPEMMLFKNLSEEDVVTANTDPQLIIPLVAVLLTTCAVGIFGNTLILVAVLISQVRVVSEDFKANN